jgi:hypothetical protein
MQSKICASNRRILQVFFGYLCLSDTALKKTFMNIPCAINRSQQWNEKQVRPHVIDSPNLPRDTRVKVTLVTRPLTPVMQKLSTAERVFSVESLFE